MYAVYLESEQVRGRKEAKLIKQRDALIEAIKNYLEVKELLKSASHQV